MSRFAVLASALLAAASARAAEDVGARVLAWGDSLTAGGDWLGWLAGLGHPDWTAVDQGLAGEASWYAAEGIEALGYPDGRFRDWLAADYAARSKDVFVFLWGTNDVRAPDFAGDGVPPGYRAWRQTRDALAQVVGDALGRGKPVVVAVPPPIVGGTDARHTPEEAALFNSCIRDLLQPIVLELVAEQAARGQVVLAVSIYDHWLTLPGWPSLDYFRFPDGSADGVHPGTEPGPSGHSGRYHLAEPLVAAIETARSIQQARAVPSLPTWAAVLGFLLLGGAGCALARYGPRP